MKIKKNFLEKYTTQTPRKVWKVNTRLSTCDGCIFNIPAHKRDTINGGFYKCNRRNLTANGYNLNELFIPQNFTDWRCESLTSFRYKEVNKKLKNKELI